ncbi:helix-turn-helix domain-containing protein [Erythrobacter sp. R86502]|uniref:helix-turn-helix domain-containing protein n=1 Tax=Erythrobacter sp. R86502 TaxID=3093846 RepID=UPI0036D301C5
MGGIADHHAASGPAPPSGARLTTNFREPPAQFAGCFTTFYHLTLELPDTAPRVTDFLQPEWANIRFFCGTPPEGEIAGHRLSGAQYVASGPSTLPCRFTLGPVHMWGVGFLPLGWARFFQADACEYANILCDGSQHEAFRHFAGLTQTLCDPDATHDDQYDALVAAMTKAMRPNRDEPRIARIHSALVSAEHTSVHDLADACAMSIRTLERMCMRYFGFAPKVLLRRQRFMRSLATFMLHQGRPWTEAMDEHYHDQAQFTREFHAFMTMNPTEFAALDHPILASFMEARMRARGSAAQTLDPPSQRP